VGSRTEETNLDISRAGREEDRSRKVEGRSVLCNNTACKNPKRRPEGDHKSYPGSSSKIRATLVKVTNDFIYVTKSSEDGSVILRINPVEKMVFGIKLGVQNFSYTTD